MKKLMILVALGIVMLSGCNSKNNSESEKSSEKLETTEESVYNPFMNMSNLGDGEFNISSDQGNTLDNTEVVIRYSKDNKTTPIKIETKGINGEMSSFIFADGQLIEKLHLTDSTETVDLQKVPSALTEGIHELELVQYDDDRRQNGIPTFKKQNYTVVMK